MFHRVSYVTGGAVILPPTVSLEKKNATSMLWCLVYDF